MSPHAPLAYQAETIPTNEQEVIERAVNAMGRMLAHRDKTGVQESDVHPNPVGFATGEFRVLDTLPPELRQGLFQKPGTYKFVARFSNSSHIIGQFDNVKDARGLAIKVVGVQGERVTHPELRAAENEATTQDFVMIDNPTFVVRNAAEYAVAEELQGSQGALGSLLVGVEHPVLTLRTLFLKEELVKKPIVHPLVNRYFSMTPIRYGNYVAKYSVRPADQTPLPPPPPDDKHGLHTVLRNALTERPVVLNFQVQLRRSEEMPIDDATVLWSEEESPFVTVATLRFPQQDIDRPTLQGARQALAFNVWHALEIHRPMGSLNRVRLYAYHKSVEWRNHCRDIPEPSGLAQFD